MGYPVGRHPDEFRGSAGTEKKPYEKRGDDDMEKTEMVRG